MVMGNITLARALNPKKAFWYKEQIRADRARQQVHNSLIPHVVVKID
jgi:hypothetical protein